MNFDFSKLDSFVTEKMAEYRVPSMSIVVVKGEEPIYTKCFGYKDMENHVAPDGDTVYAIASLSKAMTATCVGILVDEGKLSWDEPVVTYLPEFNMHDRLAGRHITLRDMLSHNTGLPRHDMVWVDREKSRTTKELVESIAHLKLNKSARSLYEYNNLMFATAGYVIERVTGKTWHEFIKERLFDPLGMSRSSSEIKGLAENENRAMPYKPSKKHPDEKAVLTEYLNFDGMAACGTVNSTISDMAKWASMNLMKGSFGNKTIISEKGLKEIHTPHEVQRVIEPTPEVPFVCYGLGWGVRVYRGHHNITHSGGIDGFSTYISLLPNENIGIVVLTNMGGNFTHFAVANTFFDHMLGLPEKDWCAYFKGEYEKAVEMLEKRNQTVRDAVNPEAAPTKALVDYAGVYEHKGYGKIRVTLEGDKLQLVYNGYDKALIHNNHDAFYFDMFDGMLEDLTWAHFVLNRKGDVSELHVEMEKAMGGELMVFEKVE